MPNIRLIPQATWDALTEVSAVEGDNLGALGLGEDTYRAIRSDSATGVVSTLSATGAQIATNVGIPAIAGTFSQESVRFDGTNYLTRSGAVDGSNQKNNLFYLACKEIVVNTREAIFSWDAGNGAFRFWNGPDNFRLTINGNHYETSSFMTGHADTFVHILAETSDDGASGIDIKIWAFVNGESWAEVLSTNVASSTGIQWAGKATSSVGTLTTISQTANVKMSRFALWTGLGTPPDISASGTRDLFAVDGDTIEDPATSVASLGTTPKIDFNGPASEYNSGTHEGSLSAYTPLTTDFTNEV